ncbi:uncharacterized protein CBL_09731 [Carabus blaptoides fortunei]
MEIDTENDEEKQREITRNFLAGKLSFSEYAAQMEDDENQEETLETSPQVTEEPSTSTATEEVKKEGKIRGAKRKIIRRPLPPTLKGLMGEANLRYVRGDHKTAEQMCLEVIRQIPTVPDPFLTLAQMYEVENPEKSLQFALIAAHLSPNDDGQWIRLAVLSENLKNLKQADTCYAKAISANQTNISLHLKRIKFLETHGDDRLVTKAKMRALTYMSSEHHDVLIPMAKDLTQRYHQGGEIAKAMEALDAVFKKCPNQVSSELVNIMLELLLTLKKYKCCLEIFVQHCNIDVEIENDLFTTESGEIEEKMKIVSYNLPVSLPIDLHIKFIICLVHLRSFDLLQPLLEPLLCEEEGVEKNGDLYLDVAEALMAEDHHSDALKLLVPLVKSKNFGMAAVWLRHAECLSACSLHEQAIDSYKKVMELAPMHLQMRYPLAELLINMDRKSEALAILEQDETCEELDSGLLFKRCKLLKELKFMNKYWSTGLLLLSRHCFTVRNRDEVEKLTCMQRPDRRGILLKSLRAAKGEDVADTTALFDNKNEPSVEEEFTLFKDLVESCMKRRRYDLMQRLTFTALSSKRFKVYKTDLELMAVFACIYNEDCFHGYNLVREMVQHNLDSKKCWNLYNLMIQRSDDGRHNRFLMRLLLRASVDPYINILHANNCLVAGTYKYALSEYISLYRIQEEPLFALLIGVTFFQIASQKFSVKKDFLVIQGMGFMSIYKKLRGADAAHEADYNIGRGYHQLGMLHLAAEHYKKVLKTKTSLTEKYPNLFDLKREAAYNLHLIYKASGASDLAKMYLFKYIIV